MYKDINESTKEKDNLKLLQKAKISDIYALIQNVHKSYYFQQQYQRLHENGKGKMKTFQIQGKYQLLENRSGNDFC